MRHTGFEPVTSCLSSKRSKPTELMPQVGVGVSVGVSVGCESKNFLPIFVTCDAKIREYEKDCDFFIDLSAGRYNSQSTGNPCFN